jgi:hypothetical protein
VTGTITSSLQPYWAYRHDPGGALPAGEPPATPTAISIFGGAQVPFSKPPRELAERYFNVVRWAEHDRGGHFPAWPSHNCWPTRSARPSVRLAWLPYSAERWLLCAPPAW